MGAMRLLLLGPPGAGKGTQAQRLSTHFGVEHIATGDLLRQAVAADTPLGQKAKSDMERGDLVPDELIMELVASRLTAAAERGGYILDGFPRTLRQALLAEEEGIGVDVAVHLDIDAETAVRRMLGRAASQHRADDLEGTIRHRIAVFERDTFPLCRYYRERGVLVDVDAGPPADEVTAAILRQLAGLGG
jgi:adenylate kinase